jgi:large subunit ribosomal protein L13
MAKIYVDAEDGVMGRVASFAAKQALQGNEVFIFNSDKAIISGTNTNIIGEFKELRALNTNKPEKGPFISKNTEKILKRAITRMLPDYRIGRGRVAWKKIKCYNQIPEEFKKEKLIKIKSKSPKNFITIGQLSRGA